MENQNWTKDEIELQHTHAFDKLSVIGLEG